MDLLKTALEVRKLGEIGHRDAVSLAHEFHSWSEENNTPLSKDSLSSWLGGWLPPRRGR